MEKTLPSIPAKRYFTIGEVGELCDVKPHVLRYWEQEFTQLRPMKRRGNRRYYQHHEVLMIRRIRDLLYDQGFTISGARNRLQELAQFERGRRARGGAVPDALEAEAASSREPDLPHPGVTAPSAWLPEPSENAAMRSQLRALRRELLDIRQILSAEGGSSPL